MFEDARRAGYVRVRVDGEPLRPLAKRSTSRRTKSTTSRSSWTGLIVRPDITAAPDGLCRDGIEPARGGPCDRGPVCAEGQDLHVFPELRLRRLRHLHRGADAAHVLVQQPLRRLPHLYGARQPAASADPTPASSRTTSSPSSTGRSSAPGLELHPAPTASAGCILKRSRRSISSRCAHPVKELPAEVRQIIFYGTKGEKLEMHYDQPRGKGVLYQAFEGVANNLERRYRRDAERREQARRSRSFWATAPARHAAASACSRRHWPSR